MQPDQDWPLDPFGLWGEGGLGGAEFQISAFHNRHPADKVLADEIRTSELVDLVNLAPLTRAFQWFKDLRSIWDLRLDALETHFAKEKTDD